VKRIKKWGQRSAGQVYKPLRRWLIPPYRTHIVEDRLPELLKNRLLYIVQEDGYREQAAMLCPCGCNQVLHMNLLPDEHPCWRLTLHKDGTATLHPSIRREVNCLSHFWFVRGRIRWFKQEGSWNERGS